MEYFPIPPEPPVVDPNLKRCVEAYYRAFNARDERAYLACFHPEGAVGGTLTGKPLCGVGVQKAILRTASGSMGDLTMNAVSLFQAQQEVAVAWAGDVRNAAGARFPVEGISLFAFDEEGLIRLARVFWNPRPLTGSGPADPSAVDALHRQAIERYFAGFNAREWDALMSLFMEGALAGGTLVGSGLRGGASLRSAYETVVARFPGLAMHPGLAYQAQNEVAVHWVGEAQREDGAPIGIQGSSLFAFDPEGRIARYRIYWDPRPLLQEA